MGRPVVGREDLQGTKTSLEWSLGRYKAIVAGGWIRADESPGAGMRKGGGRGGRRPQEAEATRPIRTLLRSWWGQV